MPYKVENTNLRFGNNAYPMRVLNAWKAYDDGDLDKVIDMFADDVWAHSLTERCSMARKLF